MSEAKIKFSVIIPVYNASEFLRDTLDSVRNQTHTDYEVLVTNDGSSDDTEKVLKNYKKANPKFPLDFITQENRGVSSSRNNAIFRSTGDYLAFLDQDDQWLPKKLERTAHILHMNMGTDVLYHDVLINGAGRDEELWKSRVLKEPVYNDLLFNGNGLGISAAIVRLTKVEEVGGFSEELFYVEDYDLWLRLARKNANFYYAPVVLGKYFWRKGAMSGNAEKLVKEALSLIEHCFNLLKEENKYNIRLLDKKLKRRASDILFSSSRRFYYSKDYKKALEYSKKAFNKDCTYWKPYIGIFLSYLKFKRGYSVR